MGGQVLKMAVIKLRRPINPIDRNNGQAAGGG